MNLLWEMRTTRKKNLKLDQSLLHILSENLSRKAMSWLPNPFKSLQPPGDEESASDGGVASGGSVKDDLSVIGESIGRQLRGVAAFLAPPPSPPASIPDADDYSSDARSPRLAGIRNDLAEISGSFKSSLSLLSSNKAVIGISKLASNFLQLNEGGEEEAVEDHGVGISDEVVDFVTEISERPECWTDFPLSLNDNGKLQQKTQNIIILLKDDDFTMSHAQAEHISVMEQLVPTLSDLKSTLCTDLSEKQFWMIYFILLLPRLNENSLNILSTPEIVEARSTLLTMLQHKRNSGLPDSVKKHREDGSSKAESSNASGEIQQTEIQGIEKSSEEEEDGNTDSSDAQRRLHSEDQISFSDLEDDDTDVSTRRYSSGRGRDAGTSSPDGSSDWVRLDKSAENSRRRSREGKPSSQSRDSEVEDWLTIDEFDNYNEAAT
ncbi:hypothetical protein V2J09_018769 [Rumex salicifolius]